MTTKTLTGYYVTGYNLTSPITTLSIAASAYLGGGIASAGANTYTIVNQGRVIGAASAISLTGRGVITNSGTLESTSTTASAGIILGQGGVVTNNVGGLISGYYGVAIATQTGTVNNQGTIFGVGGIELALGGVVTNGSASNTTATIRGSKAIIAGAGATVTNFGTILGTGTAGVGGYLKLGGVMTNGSATDKTALIEAAGIGFAIEGATGTMTNYGTVVVTGPAGAGLALTGGGVMTNGSASDTTALIRAGAAGFIGEGVAATVNNFGTIQGGYGTLSVYGAAVYLKNGGTITNGTTKDTTASITGIVAAAIGTVTGTIYNFGVMGGTETEIGAAVLGGGLIVNGSSTDTTARIQAYIGAAGGTNPTTIENFGTIIGTGAGGTISSLVSAVYIGGGGVVTNGSSVDTKATLSSSAVGIHATTIAATVSNFGDISGALVGILMDGGGKVTNGSSADTGATISGTVAGVGIGTAVGTVINFGTIQGGVLSKYGVDIQTGGSVTNGSSTDHVALIKGFIGVDAAGATSVTNNASIRGDVALGSYGVILGGTSRLTNNAGATISGREGVVIGAGCTANDFGVIQGLDGEAVKLTDATARLNLQAGASLVGDIIDSAGGTVDVVGGVVTANGIEMAGRLIGAGTLSLAGGPTFFYAGAGLSVAKLAIGTGAEVFVDTKLTDATIWAQSAGTLSVESGDQMTFTGKGDSFSGTVSGAGTFELDGGTDALGNLTLSAGTMKIVNSTVTVSGAIDLTGSLSVSTPNLIVAAAGVSLTGGGTVSLANSATNSIHGASGTATLTNSDIIRGAGKLGGGTMTLINTAAGTIQSAGTVALTVDTGTATIANAGLIEAQGGGGMAIKSAVANTGTLTAFNGTLTVSGAVSGAGLVRVVGGVADFTSTFSENVAFGSTGRLVLSHGQTYGGTISGFSHTGTTSLDLADIAFSGGTTATYSGTTAAGILTVSDGAHTAKIHLTGNYLAATWTLSAATGGGTHVVDPTAPRPKTAPLVAAMAGFGATTHVAATALSSQAWMTAPPMVASAHGP